MYYFILVIIGLFGVLIGSFLNVVILRFDTEEHFWQGRSHCMKCNHVLEWYDLFPLFSFLFLRGKCRYCGVPLSWQYPLVEAFTSLMAILTFVSIIPSERALLLISWPDVVRLGFSWLLMAQLIVIFVYDLKYMLIPEITLRIVQALGIVWVIYQSILLGGLYSGVWTGLALALAIFALYVGTKKQGMGFGDVELILGLGFFVLFVDAFLFFFLSFLIGSVWGIGLLLATRKKSLKVKMPFGPSIILAFWVVFLVVPRVPLLQMLRYMIQ